jgi:FAD/FMN-containing dehydrogenase
MCVEGLYAYMPFAASEDIASPAAGTNGPEAKAQELFGENYAKLQRLKKEYDPDLVFFKWNPITPQA